MTHVQISVHKGIADVTKLDPGIEVQLIDKDVKSIVVFTRKGKHIDWRVLKEEEEHKVLENSVWSSPLE